MSICLDQSVRFSLLWTTCTLWSPFLHPTTPCRTWGHCKALEGIPRVRATSGEYLWRKVSPHLGQKPRGRTHNCCSRGDKQNEHVRWGYIPRCVGHWLGIHLMLCSNYFKQGMKWRRYQSFPSLPSGMNPPWTDLNQEQVIKPSAFRELRPTKRILILHVQSCTMLQPYHLKHTAMQLDIQPSGTDWQQHP